MRCSVGATVRTFVRCWESLQVELHGQYSLARLDELLAFNRQTSTLGAMAIVLLTPLACVVLMIVPDMLPLRPPADGLWHQSATYWIRTFFTFTVSSAIIMLQFWYASPRLPMVKTQFAAATVFVGAGLTVSTLMFHLLIGFPTPFVVQLTAFPGQVLFVSCLWAMWKTPIRDDREVQRDLWQFVWVCMSEFAMTLTYPVMIYVFGLLSAHHQTLFALCFPFVKLAIKNSTSLGLYRREDIAPVFVVLCVDGFHALLLSCVMRSATSNGTLVSIMCTDLFQNLVAIVEVRALLRQLERLRVEIFAFDAATSQMCRLHVETSTISLARAVLGSHPHIRTNGSIALPRHLRPSLPPRDVWRSLNHIAPDVGAISGARASTKMPPQVEYVRLSLKLLHMVEFYMLIEFTEVVVAVIYAIYLTAMFHLPNRDYYLTLKTLAPEQMKDAVDHVLEYAALELLSLVVLGLVLDRLLGLSTLKLLAFTLHKHALLVQSLLVFWVLLTTQLTLEHLGNDYTFRFQWLRHPQASSGDSPPKT